MPRINKTQFALLGCLSIRPMSAYEVKKFMSVSTHYFWMEYEAQLYPTLKKLEKSHLVKSHEETAEKGGVRNLYEITDKGLDVLREWLIKKTDKMAYRNEFLLKLFFGDQIDIDTSIHKIKEYQDEATAQLTHFQQIEKEVSINKIPKKRQPFILATIKYGIHLTKAEIAWCAEMMLLLREK